MDHEQNDSECLHEFVPQRNAHVPPSRWIWLCRCGAVMRRTVEANVISAADLNLMIDSSLRHADRVFVDNQSVKGEKWVIRHAEWEFRPFRFEIAYHLVDQVSFVLLFNVVDEVGRCPVPDTATYRRLLDLSRALKT